MKITVTKWFTEKFESVRLIKIEAEYLGFTGTARFKKKYFFIKKIFEQIRGTLNSFREKIYYTGGV